MFSKNPLPSTNKKVSLSSKVRWVSINLKPESDDAAGGSGEGRRIKCKVFTPLNLRLQSSKV